MRIIEKDGTIMELEVSEFMELRKLKSIENNNEIEFERLKEFHKIKENELINNMFDTEKIKNFQVSKLSNFDKIENDKEKIDIIVESKYDDVSSSKKVRSSKSWKDNEDNIIINNDLSINKMCELLPHRTLQAIYLRRTFLRRLGKFIPVRNSKKDTAIHRDKSFINFPTFKNKKTNGGMWSNKEIEQLINLVKNNTNFDIICSEMSHRTIDSLRKKIEQIHTGEIKRHPNYKRHNNMSIEQKKKQSEMMIKINGIASELRKNGVDWNTSLREANKIYKRQKEKGEL